jgi:hypothetical protein
MDLSIAVLLIAAVYDARTTRNEGDSNTEEVG